MAHHFICPNCGNRTAATELNAGFRRQARGCSKCGFGFLFELLDDYYPAPDPALVLGLFLASVAVIAAKKTRLGLDLKGGVSLVYQAKPTKQAAVTSDAINRALDIMRERVDQLGVAEPEIQRSGPDQIDVSLPD